jgi:hypothetical protein
LKINITAYAQTHSSMQVGSPITAVLHKLLLEI